MLNNIELLQTRNKMVDPAGVEPASAIVLV